MRRRLSGSGFKRFQAWFNIFIKINARGYRAPDTSVPHLVESLYRKSK